MKDERKYYFACPHNDGVDCRRRTCDNCGWLPEVEAKRKAKIREAFTKIVRVSVICLLLTLITVAKAGDYKVFKPMETERKPRCPDIVATVSAYDLISEWLVMDECEVIVLAKMVWGEARGLSDTERAATVWCVLNRVDAWGKDIISTVTAAGQFTGYRDGNPVDDDIAELVEDVLARWEMEKLTGLDYGRVLPSEYLFFAAKNGRNVFRTEYKGGTRWDWSIESPYEVD